MTTLVLLMALGVAGGLGASPVQAASLEFVPASKRADGHPAQVASGIGVGMPPPSLAVFDGVVTCDPAYGFRGDLRDLASETR